MRALKNFFYLSALFLGLASVPVQARTIESLKFFGDSTNPDHLSATLNWDTEKKICSIYFEKTKHPLALDYAECKEIADFITSNREALTKIAHQGYDVNERRLTEGAELPLYRIEWDSKKFAILASSPEVCSLDGTHCRPSSKQIPDELGFKFLTLITKHQKEKRQISPAV